MCLSNHFWSGIQKNRRSIESVGGGNNYVRED